MVAFTATLKRQARRLYDEGHGCNAIARQLDVTPSTISTWAKTNELKFDRSQTSLAVRAHVIDLRESNTLLAKKLQAAAHDLVDSLDGPYTLRQLGRGQGKDAADTWHEHTVDHAPVEVVRNVFTTAAIAIDKAAKVLDNTDRDLSAVDQWLEHMTGVPNG